MWNGGGGIAIKEAWKEWNPTKNVFNFANVESRYRGGLIKPTCNKSIIGVIRKTSVKDFTKCTDTKPRESKYIEECSKPVERKYIEQFKLDDNKSFFRILFDSMVPVMRRRRSSKAQKNTRSRGMSSGELL